MSSYPGRLSSNGRPRLTAPGAQPDEGAAESFVRYPPQPGVSGPIRYFSNDRSDFSQ
jgi:hypothetical protein